MICMVKNLPTANFILRGKSEKYTKENMTVECFGSHFSHNGPFNLKKKEEERSREKKRKVGENNSQLCFHGSRLDQKLPHCNNSVTCYLWPVSVYQRLGAFIYYRVSEL